MLESHGVTPPARERVGQIQQGATSAAKLAKPNQKQNRRPHSAFRARVSHINPITSLARSCAKPSDTVTASAVHEASTSEPSK
mmetsp:Transcript_7151/g.18227  ORF Transcript_7151/g.18227 Transcript_7151/m.18227 type:complete len:83 (+) Transcript_7151:210-458(+)